MKKAISKERVDIIKTENSPKIVVNICKNSENLQLIFT
jgi:hypothetical protein